MKRIYLLLSALFLTLAVNAQIQSLSDISSSKKYLLMNVNGYGYCIYSSTHADYDQSTGSSWYTGSNYLTLGGATVEHPDGNASTDYSAAIDRTAANNQWYIQKTGSNYYLKNVGMSMYATNQYSISWGGWGGGGGSQTYTMDDECWQLTSTATAVSITALSTGVFAFRLASSTDDTRYLCAAGWCGNAIANWTTEDLGSQWWIIDAEASITQVKSITLNQTSLALTVGSTFELTATVSPDDATYPTVVWGSSNEKVATVANGKVTALKSGNATITASATDGSGVKATCSIKVSKQEDEDIKSLGTIHYFTLADGQLVAIPDKYITSRTEEGNKVSINLTGDTAFVYTKGLLASEDTVYNGDLPKFESFKFNNKFNDQLFDDVDGVINDSLNTIDFDVACIGKRLTPSFKLPEEATAWVDGVQQHSKKSSQRFDEDKTYTLAYPNNWIYRVHKVSDAVYSNPESVDTKDQWISTKVDLTADMLSTNAPSNKGEDPDKMLDGDPSTFFHSTWGSGTYTPLTWSEGATYGDGTSEWPYLQIDLPDAIYTLKFSYTTRSSNSKYSPLGFIIQGSNDGTQWDDAYEIGDKDNLPTGAGETYTSPEISLGNSYKHLRFQLTASGYKNYLVMSEFSLYKVTENPDYGKDTISTEPILITPAVYKTGFMPFGRDYNVHVNFRTDNSTSQYNVPIIKINTFDGSSITSKTTYKQATFELDGAGIWDDLKVDTMQIKGRGNTSWSSSSTAKNPYHLKFSSKVKPFGLTKGKNWVLLANKQTGSMTSNAIAMKLADMVKTKGRNHILPVELYINGDYRGSYNFTEKVGFSNNSIDLDDESNAALLELDSYYDETSKFKDKTYSLPVNIKEPDFSDTESTTNLTLANISAKFNDFTECVSLGTVNEEFYSSQMDVEAFARAWFVNDFVRNQECKHPKSWFLYNENVIADSLWTFGPVWDFDWSFGYDGSYSYFVNGAETDIFDSMTSSSVGYNFFHALVNNSNVIKKAYYKLWTEFLGKGDENGGLSKLLEWCDDYLDFANPSFQHNATKWSDGNAYATSNTNAKNWLTKRANYIYSHLTKFDLSGEIEEEEKDIDFGQPDRIDPVQVVADAVDVYTLQGVRLRTHVPYIYATHDLMPGIYIVGGKKVLVR